MNSRSSLNPRSILLWMFVVYGAGACEGDLPPRTDVRGVPLTTGATPLIGVGDPILYDVYNDPQFQTTWIDGTAPGHVSSSRLDNRIRRLVDLKPQVVRLW